MDSNPLLPQVRVNSTQLLGQLQSGRLLQVDPRCSGGFILRKRHHAEFVGAGGAIGGLFDLDCVELIPVGNAAIAHPETYEERQAAYTTRQQWSQTLQQATELLVPLQRAQAALTVLSDYLGTETATPISDELLALLVGVLPKTIASLRQSGTVRATPSLQQSAC
ncbi:hypothetical protein QPK87_07865 [Kamptonema cortianum]|nr:hypothetical protein [Kamptonema cortianum]